jgi:hypothetical protein
VKRTITIKRDKHFAGCLIKYFCMLNVSIQHFKKWINDNEDTLDSEYRYTDNSYSISNGKEISIDIDENENTLFVVAYTSTGIVYSNEIIIESGYSNQGYLIKTKYSFSKGSSYLLVRI